MRAIATFVATAFALGIALSLVVGLTGGNDSPYIGLRFAVALAVPIAVLVTTRLAAEPPHVAGGWPGTGYVLAAVFLIPVTLHAVTLPTLAHLEGAIPWASWLRPQADGLYHTPAARGWGDVTAQGLAIRIALNLVVGLVATSALAFLEEIGWRAWLLPRLVPRLGARVAVVATSIVWGLWHVPFGLSGIQHIDGMSALRVAIGVPLGTMVAGLIIGWLWLRTNNVWIVALAHGSFNNWGQYAFKYMDDGPPGSDVAALRVGFLALLVVGTVLLLFFTGSAGRSAGPASAVPPVRR
jgi:membrane protease YdiL (CAAX protease family)